MTPPGTGGGPARPSLDDQIANFDDGDATFADNGDRYRASMPLDRPTDPVPKQSIDLERPTDLPPPPKKPQTPDEFYARYTVGPPVGSGGMAEVHLGYENLPGVAPRPCVIKRIVREFAKQPAYREMFTEEVRLSRLLHHPNVVTAYTDGEVANVPYIVFELIDGVTFKDFARLAGEPIPPSIACHLAIEVTKGLAYAHSALGEDGEPMKLVHRDVSPQNVLVSKKCEVKLVDFGIARFEGRMHATLSGEVKGKLKYMALEQIEEIPVDGRADIFALGIVIGEMLGILADGFTDKFVSGLLKDPKHVPKPLYELLLRMTAAHADDRPASSQVLLAELIRVQAQLPKVKLEDYAPKIFAKHKSVLNKAPAPAPKRQAPLASAEIQGPVIPQSDGGGFDDIDVEETIGYAELLANGHMPILPSEPDVARLAVPVERPTLESVDPPPPPPPPPPVVRATPQREASKPNRALDEPTDRMRLKSAPKAMPTPLPRSPSAPMPMQMQMLPPGLAGITPEMLAELSSRSGFAQAPTPPKSKLAWVLAGVLAILAIMLLTAIVTMKLSENAPARTTTTQPGP